MPNLAEKLRRFAGAAQFNPNVHIAGHSMGGAIAMLYSVQYPLEIKSLILADAAGVFKNANTPYLKDPAQLRQTVVERPGDFNRLMDIAMQTPPFIPEELKTCTGKSDDRSV